MPSADSTVTTPSLPTLANASASISPISASSALRVATRRMSSLVSTGWERARTAPAAAAAAASIPRRSSTGEAPALSRRRPSSIIARRSTVAGGGAPPAGGVGLAPAWGEERVPHVLEVFLEVEVRGHRAPVRGDERRSELL